MVLWMRSLLICVRVSEMARVANPLRRRTIAPFHKVVPSPHVCVKLRAAHVGDMAFPHLGLYHLQGLGVGGIALRHGDLLSEAHFPALVLQRHLADVVALVTQDLQGALVSQAGVEGLIDGFAQCGRVFEAAAAHLDALAGGPAAEGGEADMDAAQGAEEAAQFLGGQAVGDPGTDVALVGVEVDLGAGRWEFAWIVNW